MSLRGITSFILSGDLLKGSVVSDKRCDLMVERSRMFLEDGSITGSRIKVAINGSVIVVNHKLA